MESLKEDIVAAALEFLELDPMLQRPFGEPNNAETYSKTIDALHKLRVACITYKRSKLNIVEGAYIDDTSITSRKSESNT